MTNIYWSVYKNLESEFNKLMFNIHIDDNQMNVYSTKISDLMLRAATEIESISKDLYASNNGTKTINLKYDEDAIKHLNKLWLLDKKVVIVSSYNCFQTQRELKPFEKNENRTGTSRKTFSWNNSYQNLKHNRANSLHFGSIKYLFDIMAALFILNLYYKNEVFDLEKDDKGTNLPINMGSDIFSIKIHKWSSYDEQGVYGKKDDFSECMYFIKYTDKSHLEYVKAVEEMQNKQREIFIKHPKFINYLKKNDIATYEGNNLMWDVLGKDEYIKITNIACTELINIGKKTKYEAMLNKNQI